MNMNEVDTAGKMLRKTLAGYAQKQSDLVLEVEHEVEEIRGVPSL